MNPYAISALIATIVLFSFYMLSLKRYPIELDFNLPNHTAKYKVSKRFSTEPFFSVSLNLKTKSSLGGICLFTFGGYTVDIRVQDAKVLLIFKITSSNVIKLTLKSKYNIHVDWNDLKVSAVKSDSNLKVNLNLNGDIKNGTVYNVKGLPSTPNTVLFGHLNFKGCLKNLYFNNEMVHDSDLNLINVIKGCSG